MSYNTCNYSSDDETTLYCLRILCGVMFYVVIVEVYQVRLYIILITMKHMNILSLILFVVIGVGGWYIYQSATPPVPADMLNNEITSPSAEVMRAINHLNTAYLIEGQLVALQDGVATLPVSPGSVVMTQTQVLDAEAFADVNGDGTEDVVFALSQSTGTAEPRYYVAVALETSVGFIGSAAYFLGEQLVIEGISYENGIINVETQPQTDSGDGGSVGAIVSLQFDSMTGQIVPVGE